MPWPEVAARVAGLEPIAPLRDGDNDDPIPPQILAAVEKALRAGDTHYTARPGLMELREALARRIARCGGPVIDPATDVVITAGAEEALFVSVFALGLGSAWNLRRDGLAGTLAPIDGAAPNRSADEAEATPKILDAAHQVATGGPWPQVDLDHRTLLVGSLDSLPGVGSFRVGYVLGRGALMNKVRSAKQALSICTAAPSQRAALQVLAFAEEAGASL